MLSDDGETTDNEIVLSDDKERYLQMAIRINPNDIVILYRKIEYKSLI